MAALSLNVHWNAPEDILAVSNSGEPGLPPLIPQEIQTFGKEGKEGVSQGILMKLRNEDGSYAGFGSELEIYPEQPDGPMEVYLTLVLVGRGTIYVHEVKQNNDLTEIITGIAGAEVWEGEQPVIYTAGPREDRRSEIIGGTGEFAGAEGNHYQTCLFTKIVPGAAWPIVKCIEHLTLL